MLDTVLSALRDGDSAAAETAARALLAQEPDNAQAAHLLGVSLQRKGDLAGAEAAYVQAMALAPEQAEYHVAHGLLAAHRRDHSGAQASLGRALAQDPNQLAAYLSLAQLALGRRDLAEAERQLRMADRINPDHPHLLALHGQIMLAHNRGEEALTYLTRAAEGAPDDGLVQSVLGIVLLALGRHAFAEQALRNGLEKQPQAAALRHALLRALLAQGRDDEANEEANHLLRTSPNDAAALALRGQLALRRGDVDQARAAYEQSLLTRPHPGVLQSLHVLHQETDTVASLVPVIEATLARHPGFDAGWIALLSFASGDSVRTAALIERWYVASPVVPATEMLAQMSEGRGDFGRAAELAQQVVARDPLSLSAQTLLARADLRAGDGEAAAKRLYPLVIRANDPASLRTLVGWYGHALDRKGDPAGAVNAWRQGHIHAPMPPPLPSVAAEHGAADTALERAERLAAKARKVAGPDLLWGPPGSGVEVAAALLRDSTERPLASDRFSITPRTDAFDHPDGLSMLLTPLKANAEAFVEQWHAGLTARDRVPGSTMDWLPHLDRRVLPMIRAAAPATRLVVVLRDPRDMLLNWLAFGSPQRYACAEPATAAHWLADILAPLVMLREQPVLSLLELGDGIAAGSLSVGAEALGTFLELRHAPDPSTAQQMRNGQQALPTAFPDNHWRVYAEALAPAFALLQPVAVRLGYPAA